LENELVQLYDDKDPKVRYQLLCTLGLLHSDAAESAKQFILLKDVEDKWIQIAALASSPGKEWALMEKVRRSPANVQSEGRQLFFINTGAVIGLSRQEDAMQQIIRTAAVSVPKNDAWWKAALLEGLIKGLSVEGFTKNKFGNEKMMLLALFKADTDPTLRRSSLRLLQALGISEIPNQTEELKSAKDIAIDQKADPQFREDAILLLSLMPGKSNENILANLISPTEPENVQKIAVRTFIHESGPKACNIVLAAWKQLTAGVRDEAMDQFMESTDNMQVLLNAVQRGEVQPSTIGWRRMVDLMNNEDPGIREKSRKLLASVTENRDEAYKKYEPVLKMNGDAVKGYIVFQKNCAVCHLVGGISGISYGPDLASIRNREAQFILADIINPNRSIADGFENWTITLPDGKKEKGIISNETPSAITLKDAGGKEKTIQRSQVKSLESDKTSAMPPGLESNISIPEMADLLAYLKKGK